MLTVYQLKSRFQDILRPLCDALARRGVTANQVTLVALGASIIYGLLLCLNLPLLWLLLPVFLVLRMGLNAIDGMLAREHNMKTRLGMALNELGDVVADTFLFLPFMVLAPSVWIGVTIFIVAALLTEFCGLLAYMMKGERRYDGPMGKSDRAAVTGTLGLALGLGLPAGAWIMWVFIGLAALCIWTCRNRINAALVE